MLLSRFWYLVLAAVAAITMVSTSIVSSTYRRDRSRDAETLLRGDRQQIDTFLRTDARVRLDALAGVAADAELGRMITAALTRANDGGALQEPSRNISRQLRTLNEREAEAARSQLLLAVDSRGVLVGRTGISETSGLGDFVGGLPLIDRALRGYVRDDTWELQGRVYRMAARPVIVGTRYVGAIVAGREIDHAFVQHISEALNGASVGFFTGQSVYASHQGESDLGREAPRPESLSESLRALEQNEQWRTRGYTDVISVQNGQSAVVYGHVAGMVGLVGGGFVVGRPRPQLPANFLLHAPKDEVARVPWASVLGLGIGGFLLGMLWIYLEHDQGAGKLHAMLKQLAARKIDRLDPLVLRGNARRMALAINEAFEAALKAEIARGGSGAQRSMQDLDALLGETSKPIQTGAMLDIPAPPPMMGMGPPSSPSAPPFVPSKPAIPVPFKPPAPGASGSANVKVAPPPPPVAAPPTPAPPPPPSLAPPVLGPSSVAFAQTMPATPAPVPPPPGMVPAPPGMVPAPASVLVSMSDLASAAAGVAAPQGFTSIEEEHQHWREVFDQFVKTKKECGEATDTLIFERFKNTLERNKAQLVERTKCKFVRFSVYVKDNKATLKATPVK